MDPNGGIDPLAQGQDMSQQVPGVEPQYQQQTPMVGPQTTYTQTGALQYAQPQVSAPPIQQAPIQDVRPNWQQDLQYAAPENPPWMAAQQVQYQDVAPQPSSLASFDSFQAQQPQATNPAPAAYDLLAEPFTDMGLASAPAPKKPALIIIVVLIVLITIVGTGAAGFNLGYQKGATETKNKQKLPAADVKTDDEDISKLPAEAEEPQLSFELTRPDFAEEDLMGGLGEQLSASDGLVVNAYKVDTKYIPDSSDGESASGSFVKIDLLLGNADDSRPKTIKTSAFKLVDESGESYEPLDSLADGLGATGSVTLSPGMKSRMSIVYEVASGDASYLLTRSQPYQVGGQARNVSLSVDLAVADAPGRQSAITD